MSLSSITTRKKASAGWLAIPLVCGLFVAPGPEARAAESSEPASKSAASTAGSTNAVPDTKNLEAVTSSTGAVTIVSATKVDSALGTTNSVAVASTNEVAKKAVGGSETEESGSSRREDRGRDRRRRERGSGSSETPSVAANKGTDFASFKIITDRNIFSPTRTTPSAARTEAPRVPKVETFSLVGTMSYDKGDFAFFDGSGSEYRKVLKATDSIAGYKILSISETEVVLESGDKKLTLKMGGQFRRVDDGPWEQKSGGPESSETASKSSSSTDADSSAGAGGAEDEILQRLLKKREQELNNEKR